MGSTIKQSGPCLGMRIAKKHGQIMTIHGHIITMQERMHHRSLPVKALSECTVCCYTRLSIYDRQSIVFLLNVRQSPVA